MAERPPPGDRARRPRPQAVPLPRRATGAPREGEVRAADRVRQGAAGDPRAGRARPGRPGLPREKVLAAVVRLLELTLIRVGNDEYARLNRSFGLTTLRDRHAAVDGAAITFRFRGKCGKQHEVGLRDRRLAGVVRRCQDLPGQELFQYVDDDGEPQRRRLRRRQRLPRARSRRTSPPRTSGPGPAPCSPIVRCARSAEAGASARSSSTSRPRSRPRPTASATRRLSPASAYVHPAVVDAYLDGRIRAALVEAAEDTDEPPGTTDPDEERAVIALLRARLREDAARSGGGPTRAEPAGGGSLPTIERRPIAHGPIGGRPPRHEGSKRR